MSLVETFFLVTSPVGSSRCVLQVGGEIDLATAPSFRAAIEGCLVGPVRSLTVDLSGVSFMDSTGIGVLVRAWKTWRAADAELVLRAPSPSVARLLQLTNLDQVFGIEATGDQVVPPVPSG